MKTKPSLYFKGQEGVYLVGGNNGQKSYASQIDLNQVFIGEYIDEFSLGAIFSEYEPDELVLLGSSIGAGIRPALSFRSYHSINCVDR